MDISNKQIERMAKMTFASIYPHYIKKIEKKWKNKKRASSSYRMVDRV